MKLGDKELSEIVVTTDSSEVVAIISDDEVVEKEGYKVMLS